jgi:hypothetical protein
VVVVVGFLIVGLCIAIAAVFVVREAGRIGRRPPAALFDADDAFDWVVAHVPDNVAATLTPGDVRRMLDFLLEYLEQHDGSTGATGATGAPGGSAPDPVVVGGADEIAFILDRAAATGEAYLPEQVDAVIATQLAYLLAIGAIGPPAAADRAGDDDGTDGTSKRSPRA